ncbi:MAG TPA: hypothetical protein VF544_09115 [Pyrinomonadaceae bacterium]|jgi:hypothetical protein
MSGTISEAEFKRLCDRIYADRFLIYTYHPNAGSRREALLWMMLGCLVSLLSVPLPEQPSTYGGASADPYGDAVIEVLHGRMEPGFDPQVHLDELSRRIEADGDAGGLE